MRKNLPITGCEREVPARANILSTTNVKGQITYVNPDFIEISGFSQEELLGSPHNMVRHPDMPAAVFKGFWADLKAQRSWMGVTGVALAAIWRLVSPLQQALRVAKGIIDDPVARYVYTGQNGDVGSLL